MHLKRMLKNGLLWGAFSAGIFVFLMTLPVALIKLSVPNGLLQSDDFIEKVIYYGADFIYIFAIGYLISHFFVRDD